MESGREPQRSYSHCFLGFFGAIGSRQRHLFLGIIISCLAGVMIIVEFQQNSPFFAGYWMGVMCLVAAFFIFLCAAKPRDGSFTFSILIDAVCLAVTFTGSIQLLVLKSGTTYAISWIGLVTSVFLLYHIPSCIYDADICCKWKILGETEAVPSTYNDGRRVEEDPGNAGNQEERRHRRRIQSPPVDFRLPDEIPKLPDYEELRKSEGLPPEYDTLSIAPPEYAPPAT